MTAEQSQHFGRHLGERTRDITGTFLNLLNYDVTGLDNLGLLHTRPCEIAFYPHTSHLDPLSLRHVMPQELRKNLVFPAAADY